MSLRAIALRIPSNHRREILVKNLILKAVAVQGNKEMEHLMILWKNYVEPTIRLTCGICYSRVHNNFKAIQSVLIELEREDSLLNED